MHAGAALLGCWLLSKEIGLMAGGGGGGVGAGENFVPSAKTARKVTAATRANATIRVLKHSGVTAGCFCVVVSSAPAAAVALAIGRRWSRGPAGDN